MLSQAPRAKKADYMHVAIAAARSPLHQLNQYEVVNFSVAIAGKLNHKNDNKVFIIISILMIEIMLSIICSKPKKV